MKTTHRSYSEEAGDFRRLCRFAIAYRDDMRAYSTWGLGRFVDWKYGLYESKTTVADFAGQNAHLWFDAFGDVAGFTISENGDAGFAVITTAGYRFLYEEMLQWALENWGHRPPHPSVEITERQAREAAILERYGFRLSDTFCTRRIDLTQPLMERWPLEPGFTIVDMATHPDYRAQRIMRDNAFSGKTSLTEEELSRHLEFYNHITRGPLYHPQCDLCVMGPDGRFVAGCEAIIDARNVEADIERVCTHSEFRQRGLARAAIQECLYRLQDMGLRNAYITGYSPGAIALYGSLGAVDESKSFVYERAEG